MSPFQPVNNMLKAVRKKILISADSRFLKAYNFIDELLICNRCWFLLYMGNTPPSYCKQCRPTTAIFSIMQFIPYLITKSQLQLFCIHIQ